MMPLEENLHIVPHLKALISGKKLYDEQWCGSTLSLLNTLMNLSILLHKMATVPFDLHTAVYGFIKLILVKTKMLCDWNTVKNFRKAT